MKQQVFKTILLVCVLCTSWQTLAQAIELTLDTTKARNMNLVDQGDGSFFITATTNDPNIDTVAYTENYDHTQYVVLEFEYKSETGLDDFQAFYRNVNQGAAGNRRALFGPIPAATEWTKFIGFLDLSGQNWNQAYDIFRLDFGRIAGRSIEVRNFVLRELTDEEIQDRLPKELINLELNVNDTSGGLVASELDDGSYQLDTSGGDPWIATVAHDKIYEPDVTYIIEFEYRSEQAFNALEIFFQRPFSLNTRMELPALPASDTWTKYVLNTKLESDNFANAQRTDFRIDFGRQEFEDKTIFVRNLQLRKPTAEELEEEANSDLVRSRALNELLIAHLATEFDNGISSVVAKENSIVISGQVSGLGNLHLGDITVEQDYFNNPEYTSVTPINSEDGSFEIEVTRFVNTENGLIDRLYSRFLIIDQVGENTFDLVSDPHWVDDMAEIAKYNLPEKKAASIKGLDGLTRRTIENADDLVDLGVDSMKLNLILSNIYATNSVGIEHVFNGKTFYMNEANVSAFDALVKTSNDRDLAVGVVLLIPTNIANPVKRELFVHPDADRGIYSMANVTSAAGVEAYAATLDFLAARYSDPSGEYGRIAYWIVHNEVDAHRTWTYAGQKPEALYGELYQKSMRIVYNTARKYDPSAKVYASYTHHWNSKAGGNSRNFAPKVMLERLEEYSAKQGDFEWGLGYHSYPLNLFNPKTWNDAAAKTARNLNAQYITPRNLEVIDVYARQFSSLYNGKKVRTVILSENGMSSNANRLPQATLENQAAGIAFFWKKANQGLSSIENIQYHRWVDNPNEGGLEFGLWTNGGENPDDFGEKKPSWFVWQAAGTDQEDSVFDQYLSVIGIPNWESIVVDLPKETTPYRVQMNFDSCAAPQGELFVSFNGERKRPQDDGSIQFFNVASNIEQDYSIKLAGQELDANTINVDDDLTLEFDFNPIENLRTRMVGPRFIYLTWDAEVNAIDHYELYVKNAEGNYELLQTITGNRKTAVHRRLQKGTQYDYLLVPIVDGEATCGSAYTETTTTRGVRRNG